MIFNKFWQMKKIWLALIILLLAVCFISCKSSEKCSAYGEAYKFQTK